MAIDARVTRLLAAVLLIVLFRPIPAFAQDKSNAWAIAVLLNTPTLQWVFNHICIPNQYLQGHGFTHVDFADAYLIVSRLRWEKALEALARGDENESMQHLAPFLHGIIDAYWPGRVERDAEGAITQFRDCDELGNLQGMLKEEKNGRGRTATVRGEITQLMSQVIRRWKEQKSFDEVNSLLRNGPMKISPSSAAQLLTPK